VINGGQFEMNGRDMSINGLYGAGNIQNRTSTRTLTLGNANADGDFSGVVSNTGGGSSTQLLNVTKVGTGTQIFSGFNTYGGLTDVQAGTLVMASRAAAGFSSIQVGSGAVLRVDPRDGEALQLFKTVAISGTPAAPTGTIDIASGGFVASKAAGNTLATLLAWRDKGIVENSGMGLTSSWILSNPEYGLAVVDNGVLGLTNFHGLEVTSNFLIVAAALRGDANLDGSVDSLDLTVWQESYGLTSGAGWNNGDFDYDGDVDGRDFLTWQRGVTTQPDTVQVLQAVPEPGSLTLVLCGLMVGFARRRWC
jgi:autotransporter-associated beta strand protein